MVKEFREEKNSDDLLNEKLQHLVNQAQKSHNKIQKRIALNKLIMAIEQSGKLSRLTKWQGLADYEDLYNEAKSETFLEICGKIDDYKPQYPVMAWVNQILSWRFQDIWRKSQKKGITQLPKGSNFPKIPSLDELELDTPALNNNDDEMALLKDFIVSDVEGLLKTENIQGHPHATFQRILLMICDSYSWEQISQELGVPVSTASSFYQRRLRKFLPYFQKSLQ